MATDYERGMNRRSEMLLGREVMERIAQTRVIIFGVGGVGSWCAEALVRSGIRHLTIVDSDRVCVTNCNRQSMATSRTIGDFKVEVLCERLLELNPSAEVTALVAVYSPETAESFHLETYDFVIDAIDSLANKADLILRVTALPKTVTLLSSMGAALRLDPLRVKCVEFWKIEGDALARALRNRFKRQGVYPRRKFLCACSDEPQLPNQEVEPVEGITDSLYQGKVACNGSSVLVTATFGLVLASKVIEKIKG